MVASGGNYFVAGESLKGKTNQMEVVSKIVKKIIHHSLTFSFLLGFLIDSMFLPSAESVHTKEIGGLYMLIVSLSILIREYIISGNRATKTEGFLHSVFSYVISFFSGSLLSFVFIYFFRSASLAVSWPLFLILIGVMLLNEFFSSRSFRFLLDIGVLFMVDTFFVLFMLPIFLRKQTDEIFLISLVLSFIISLLYIYLLKFFSEVLRDLITDAYKVAFAIPAVVVTFYFLNVIPPVPLTTKSANIYHSVTRQEDGSYLVAGEAKPFLSFLKTKEFHYMDGEKVYFFSSVSAPEGLQAELSHVWEKYDEVSGSWKIKLEIPYSLIGGRDGGYRSYSMIENLSEGKWRVSAKVGKRRTVGMVYFNVVHIDKPIPLIEERI